MLPVARRRCVRHRRLRIAVMWVIIGASIGAPIALAFFATANRRPVTAPAPLAANRSPVSTSCRSIR
jgi:hypothetical protein